MVASFERFFSMPFLLKIIFLAGLFSPAIAITSVLTGTMLAPDTPRYEYGAATNLTELFLLIGSTIPAATISVLMVMKRKAALLLFPFGYIAASVGPIFLSTFREDVDYIMSSVLPAVAGGIMAIAYLFFSGAVRRYFEHP